MGASCRLPTVARCVLRRPSVDARTGGAPGPRRTDRPVTSIAVGECDSPNATAAVGLSKVDAGRVAVAPSGITVIGPDEPAINPLVSIASRSTLIAGGALPFVLPVPLLLGLIAAGVLFRICCRGSGR